jgi:hypothetical protein
MSRHSIGVLGALGGFILLFWLVGWLLFGLRDGAYHLLFPIGVVLLVAQVVLRVASNR